MIAELIFVLAAAQPLQIGVTSNDAPWQCNYAKVYQLADGTKLNIQVAAATKSAKIDSLPNGAVVYVCDETRSSFQIFYGTVDKPCKAGTRNGLPETQRTDCRSGWVQKKWINIISG
jgi:hypothetical protein